MKNLWYALVIVFLGGCVAMRSYTIEKPRVDTEIEGNQGFLCGKPTGEVKENKLGPNRTISVLEVEVGSTKIKKKAKQGKGIASEQAIAEVVEPQEIGDRESIVSGQESAQDKYKSYTVEKNDTLQKISKKFYGTTKKWKLVYDANKAVIKNPDRVYPGIQLKIPVLD